VKRQPADGIDVTDSRLGSSRLAVRRGADARFPVRWQSL